VTQIKQTAYPSYPQNSLYRKPGASLNETGKLLPTINAKKPLGTGATQTRESQFDYYSMQAGKSHFKGAQSVAPKKYSEFNTMSLAPVKYNFSPVPKSVL